MDKGGFTVMADLLRLEEAAQELHISIHKLRKMIYAREIGYVRIGRLILFKPSQISGYVDSHTVEANYNKEGGGGQ